MDDRFRDTVKALGQITLVIGIPILLVWSKSPKYALIMLACAIVALAALVILTIRNARYEAGASRRASIKSLVASLPDLEFNDSIKYETNTSSVLRAVYNGAYCLNSIKARNGSWQYFDLFTMPGGFSGSRYGVGMSIATFKLSRALPSMFFISKSHKSPFLLLFRDVQVNSLDVNFDDHYVTFFPINYHIDGRSIISPEVLQAMMQLKDADIEIKADKIYIYSRLSRPDAISEYINTCNTIYTSLNDHIGSYVDTRISNEETSRSSVAKWGKLRRNKPWLSMTSLLFVGLTFVYSCIGLIFLSQDLELATSNLNIPFYLAVIVMGCIAIYAHEIYVYISNMFITRQREAQLKIYTPKN
jgi:hypothetical protein